METTIRTATQSDAPGVFELYMAVSKAGGSIARSPEEISPEYISGILQKAERSGFMLVTEGPGGKLIASIKAFRPGIKLFSHILHDLTILVHPEFQGMGIGRKLFSAFLQMISERHPEILRVELFCSENNSNALALYSKLGFVEEGRFSKRVKREGEPLCADVAMAWFNSSYQGPL